MTEILSFFAEHGLTGLVIAMLFVTIFAFMRFLHKKDNDHLSMTQKLLDDSRDERREINEGFKETHDKLSQAIHDLTHAIKNK